MLTLATAVRLATGPHDSPLRRDARRWLLVLLAGWLAVLGSPLVAALIVLRSR